MIIRNMTQEDLSIVCAIERGAFSQPWSEEDFRTSLEDEKNDYLVAEVDGVVVGYCGCWGVADEAAIYNVAVDKKYRRQQIGRLLLQELIEQSAKRGTTAFTLEVRSSNEPAIRLYQSLGFECEGIRKDFYSKPKEDAIIMWLRLIQ